MTVTEAGRIETQGRPAHADVAVVVARHQVGLWRYLRFLGASADLADDLAQETLVAALGAHVLDRPEGVLAAWLRTTGRNFFLASLRRAQRQGAALDFRAVEPGVAERAWRWFTGTNRDPAQLDDGTQALADLERCLARLDDRERSVLSQRYHEGASRVDIAKALDLSEAGVKALLRRVRQRLRACIERRRRDRGA